MFRTTFNCYFFLLVVSTHTLDTQQIEQDPEQIYEIQIDQDHYTGYISENVRTVKNSYVSFVDANKPSFLLTTSGSLLRSTGNPCEHVANSGYLNITMDNDGLFAYDLTEYVDSRCFINIKLANRALINREDIGQYTLVLNLNGYYNAASTITLTINVLDDNDNDPIYENYEYFLELSEMGLARRPLGLEYFTELNSTDADLKRNAFTRYMIDHDGGVDDVETIAKYFLLDYYTGVLYTKSNIADIFNENLSFLKMHVKAVNLMNELSYDVATVGVNLTRFEFPDDDSYGVKFRSQVDKAENVLLS
jgi:hypothetical protein